MAAGGRAPPVQRRVRGTIPVLQQQPSNVAFGGADYRTLYITARTAVYQVQLANPGKP